MTHYESASLEFFPIYVTNRQITISETDIVLRFSNGISSWLLYQAIAYIFDLESRTIYSCEKLRFSGESQNFQRSRPFVSKNLQSEFVFTRKSDRFTTVQIFTHGKCVIFFALNYTYNVKYRLFLRYEFSNLWSPIIAALTVSILERDYWRQRRDPFSQSTQGEVSWKAKVPSRDQIGRCEPFRGGAVGAP